VGLVTFAVSPSWLLPSGHDAELRSAPWEQVAGNSYVIFTATVLLLSAFAAYGARPVLVNRYVHVPGRSSLLAGGAAAGHRRCTRSKLVQSRSPDRAGTGPVGDPGTWTGTAAQQEPNASGIPE
jgi:hypothetical protein